MGCQKTGYGHQKAVKGWTQESLTCLMEYDKQDMIVRWLRMHWLDDHLHPSRDRMQQMWTGFQGVVDLKTDMQLTSETWHLGLDKWLEPNDLSNVINYQLVQFQAPMLNFSLQLNKNFSQYLSSYSLLHTHALYYGGLWWDFWTPTSLHCSRILGTADACPQLRVVVGTLNLSILHYHGGMSGTVAAHPDCGLLWELWIIISLHQGRMLGTECLSPTVGCGGNFELQPCFIVVGIVDAYIYSKESLGQCCGFIVVPLMANDLLKQYMIQLQYAQFLLHVNSTSSQASMNKYSAGSLVLANMKYWCLLSLYIHAWDVCTVTLIFLCAHRALPSHNDFAKSCLPCMDTAC